MKRRTRLIIIGCAIAGTSPIAAQAASAATNESQSVTVEPGDTLSAIGARISRTSEQLASYNHVSNPNLIYPDEILVIPPPNYVPAGTPTPAPAAESSTEGTATPAPAQRTYSTSVPQASGSPASGVWACIANHESGGNPSTNSGNGYYGMYQDTQSSWVAGGGLAYAPRADMASAAAQTAVNQRIQAQQGWAAWPVTSAMCGA